MGTLRRLSLAAALAACCLLLPACAGIPAGSERVLDFHSDVTVRADGTLKVTEQARLQSAGLKIKHGILRLFPKALSDARGRQQPFEAGLVDVTRDGRPAAHHFQDVEGGRTLVVADPQALLPPGEHTYTITFTTNRQVETVGGTDELAWNVVGAYWGFPIDAASATVRLPAPVPPADLKVQAYTGGERVKKEDVDYHADTGGTVQFRALRSLGVGEGMTVVLSWPAATATATEDGSH